MQSRFAPEKNIKKKSLFQVVLICACMVGIAAVISTCHSLQEQNINASIQETDTLIPSAGSRTNPSGNLRGSSIASPSTTDPRILPSPPSLFGNIGGKNTLSPTSFFTALPTNTATSNVMDFGFIIIFPTSTPSVYSSLTATWQIYYRTPTSTYTPRPTYTYIPTWTEKPPPTLIPDSTEAATPSASFTVTVTQTITLTPSTTPTATNTMTVTSTETPTPTMEDIPDSTLPPTETETSTVTPTTTQEIIVPAIVGKIYYSMINDASQMLELFTIDPNSGESLKLDTKVDSLVCAISPDGQKILIQSRSNDRTRSDLYILNSFGETLLNLTNGLNQFNTCGSWSIDGKKIVFASGDSNQAALYSIQPDGMNPVRLNNESNSYFQPSISPDNRRVAFIGNILGNTDLFVMNIEDGEMQQITNTGEAESDPVWTIDGDQIIFARFDGTQKDLFGYDLTADGEFQITNTIFDEYSPEFNQQGDMSFLANDNGDIDIYIMMKGNSVCQQLTYTQLIELNPCWAP